MEYIMNALSKTEVRILVVDDDKDIVELLYELISDEYICKIDMAYNGKEGLEKIENSINSPYHLICSDYKMPKMNGIEFVTNLRTISTYHTTPVLFITAHAPDIGALKWENVFFMNKPFAIDKLFYYLNLGLKCLVA